MSDKKMNLSKPPVPTRPKNLVILNSRHLPKPPETFSSENVANIIKDLNLDVKAEENNGAKIRKKQPDQRFETSDSEEDSYGYLEPLALSLSNFAENNATEKNNVHSQHKKAGCVSKEENSKLGDVINKVNYRNSSISTELPEVEDSKPQILQSQWQRPLPLPPVETKLIVATMPWYKNVDRKKGEEILKNGVDGYFLVRPSSNLETYLTLTLWHNTRAYNIPIRKRKDGKFALGTPKTNEQCFDSVEYLVKNYQSEKLVLYTNGVQTGKTLLTTYPP